MAKNRAIGKNGQLLWHISNDLKHFKKVTSGKCVIMGHNTYVSLPGQKALPNRRNIIISDRLDSAPEGFELATSIQKAMKMVENENEIFIMGGACEDMNVTPSAELNFWVDPEAAEVVLQSGCKITMVPLDATDKACITAEEVEMFREIGTKPALLIAELIAQRIKGYAQTYLSIQGKAPIHDDLAVCAILHPEVLEDVIETWVHVDINRGWAYGQSIVDRRARVNPEAANCRFAMGANREMFRDWMLDVLRKDKERRGL